jgi:hypothetical protein
LSKLVKVKTSKSRNRNHITNKSENLLDYSHRNRACKLKVNLKNFKYYSLISNKCLELNETLDFEEDSFFDKILPDGRLNIQDSDSEDENGLSKSKTKDTNWIDNISLLNKEFFDKCNIKLYNHEIESLSNVKTVKEKYVPHRNAEGKFVKISPKSRREASKKKKKKKIRAVINNDSCELSDDDVIVKTHIKKKKSNKHKNICDTEIFETPLDYITLSDSDTDVIATNHLQKSFTNDFEILFRPYKNYWMYHCIFSRVKGKNFDLFEKELPRNFLWLLNECANITEMTAEDLYEEVCLIEAFHFNILKSTEINKDYSDYEFHDCTSKLYSNHILKKW